MPRWKALTRRRRLGANGLMTALAFSFFPMLVPAIASAKRLGLRVICIHHQESLRAEAEAHVDQFYHVPAYTQDIPKGRRRYINLERVIEIARKENVQLILPSACGNEALEIGQLNEALGLPGFNFEQSQICADKARWNEFLQNEGLPHVPWELIREEYYQSDLQRLKDFEFPAVIKPDLGSHSQFTQTVENWSGLEEFFKKHKGFQFGTFKQMLLQKHLPGQQILAEIVVFEGKICFFSLRDVLSDPFPHDLGVGSRLPSCAPPALQLRIWLQSLRMIQSLKLRHGVLALDFICDANGQPICVDANPRPSGSGPKMIELAYGFAYIEQILRLRIGMEFSFPRKAHRASAYQLLRLKPGRIKSVKWPEPEPGVLLHNASLRQSTQAGTKIVQQRNISNNRERIYADGASSQEAWDKTTRFIEACQVEYEDCISSLER